MRRPIDVDETSAAVGCAEVSCCYGRDWPARTPAGAYDTPIMREGLTYAGWKPLAFRPTGDGSTPSSSAEDCPKCAASPSRALRVTT